MLQANILQHLGAPFDVIMASIYKRASRAETDPDLSDESMSDDEQSSGTIRADSDEEASSSDTSSAEDEATTAASKLTRVPTELRNRILMLTSRGVSFRYDSLCGP